MKRHIKQLTSVVALLCVLISVFCVNASAHDLSVWAQRYNVQSANNTYAFAITGNVAHMNGTNVNYYWVNNNSRSLFNDAFRNSFNTIWQGKIVCTETSSENAHVTLMYDPLTQPENTAAVASRTRTVQHIRTGCNDATITFYADSATCDYSDKIKICGHEVGHLFSIDDLYNVHGNTLPSIYSKTYYYSIATRHDFNALRICLGQFWFDPGNGGVWSYQESPGVFRLRGDVDLDNEIAAADSRLVLRYSANLETFTSLQKKLADVDGNNAITAADSRLILQYSAREITRFPADE